MATIEVKNLSKQYDYYKKEAGLGSSLRSIFKREKLFVDAVQEVSFSIEEGELVGFLGPNGAGKTTTLKMLSGILYPSSGEARVLGYTPWKRQKEFQKEFAIVMGQKNQLWWDLPPMESFLLNKEIYEIPESSFRATLDELTELLEVKDILDIQVRKLSLGQRMKCELIGALLHSPKVLFLDEPTIGLDVVSQNNIREFLKKYNKEKKTTILLTSHYMEDVEALCDRVILINHGRLMYDGSLASLMESSLRDKRISITFGEAVAKESLAPFGRVDEHSERSALLVVPKEKIKETVQMLFNRFPVEDITIGEPPLEEVIRHIFETQEKKM